MMTFLPNSSSSQERWENYDITHYINRNYNLTTMFYFVVLRHSDPNLKHLIHDALNSTFVFGVMGPSLD